MPALTFSLARRKLCAIRKFMFHLKVKIMTYQELKEQFEMAVAYGYANDLRFIRAYRKMQKKVKNN